MKYKRFSPFHLRISYDKIAVIDLWTSGKYWIQKTNYYHGLTERQAEKGEIPDELYDFLDKVLFAVEIAEEA